MKLKTEHVVRAAACHPQRRQVQTKAQVIVIMQVRRLGPAPRFLLPRPWIRHEPNLRLGICTTSAVVHHHMTWHATT